MKKKLANVRLVIPDAGILISLAHGDMLNILLEFADDVHIITTDFVEFEVTRRADLFDAQKITEFFANNKDRILIESTGYEDIIKAKKANPSMKLPPDLGESSIYGFINDIRGELPGIPTLVLFEDNWFSRNELGARPTMVHLVSMVSFLTYAEHVIQNFSFDAAIAKITNTRPGINLVQLDSPGKNSAIDGQRRI
jgi:hypothetical protein